jgi:hypothetical protein
LFMDASALPTTMTALHGISWPAPCCEKTNAAVPSPAVGSGVLPGARTAPVVKPRMNIPINIKTTTPFGGGAGCGV